MKRRVIVVIVTLVALVTIFYLAKNNRKRGASATETTLGATITEIVVSTTPSNDKRDDSSLGETPEPTLELATVTCSSVQKDISKLAKEFMQAHQNKDATLVLELIATPYIQEEHDRLDYWIGQDNEGTPRLYATPDTTYTISSFALGKISDRGYDSDERGSKRCQQLVTETRAVTTTIPYSELQVTRYIDFAVDSSGYTTLTAYRNSKDGSKYSGFGE